MYILGEGILFITESHFAGLLNNFTYAAFERREPLESTNTKTAVPTVLYRSTSLKQIHGLVLKSFVCLPSSAIISPSYSTASVSIET